MSKEKQYYPSWRYHKELGEKLVQNAEEDKKIGAGWVKSPADFDKKHKEEKPKDEKPEAPDHKDDGAEEKPSKPSKPAKDNK